MCLWDNQDVEAYIFNDGRKQLSAKTEWLEIDTLGHRDEKNKLRGEPLEELEDLVIDPNRPAQVLHINIQLNPQIKAELSLYLRHNANVFAWSHNDMKGLNPDVMFTD